jgi:hypothetical protein
MRFWPSFSLATYNGQFLPPFSFTPYIGRLGLHFPSPHTMVEIVSRKVFFFPDLSHSDPLRANVTLYEAKSASNDDKGMQTPVVLRVHSWSITCLIGSAPITQLING